jgi:hypothetical protein
MRSATCRWMRRPASARAAAGRIHHGRRPHADQDRCPDRCGHQQGSAPDDQPGPVPRGPVLPAQCGAACALPALRDRAEDVPDLVRHFVRHAVGEGLDAKRFDGEALDVLRQYPWPGNIRELENVVRRVAALYPQDVITREIIDNELRGRIAGTDLATKRTDDQASQSPSVEREHASLFQRVRR